ncbi:hypothetical protein Vadar_025446 [Vaccinium darrowii]|nr:hypothetical protein Vadar_025446 [Vaccinium darrowii]
MDKNINKEVDEKNWVSASETPNKVKARSSKKNGRPLSLLVPPGTVMAAANTTVVTKVATIVQEVAVSFIHCSPSLTKSCVSVNTS